MALSKQKCVVLNNNNQGSFMDKFSGIKKHQAIVFKFDKPSPNHPDRGLIVQILMHEIYVIVVYETLVSIFNAQTGDFLEERGSLDRFKYKCASLNHQTGDVVLVAHNNSNAKNIIQTKIYQLKEIPAQDQIDYLLSTCRLPEAIDIFNLKVKKGGGDFTIKQN